MSCGLVFYVFLSNPIVLGIKLKQTIRTIQLHSLFGFYLMSEDVRTKTKKFDTHVYLFLLLRFFSQHLPGFSTR